MRRSALRQTIFRLEDDNLRREHAARSHEVESEQVDKLLRETIKRNAELVDAVSTLQGQVDLLRKESAGRKVAKSRAKLRAVAKVVSTGSGGAKGFGDIAAAAKGALPKGPKMNVVGSGASGIKVAAADSARQARAVMTARERAKAGLAVVPPGEKKRSGSGAAFGDPVRRHVVGSAKAQQTFETDTLNRLWDAAADEELYGEDGGLSDVDVPELDLQMPEHEPLSPMAIDAGAPTPEHDATGGWGTRGGWMTGM